MANKKTADRKIRVLFYGDFLQSTGFGNVAMNLLKRLDKTGKFQFEVLAINYDGSPINNPDNRYYGFKDMVIHPAVNLLKGHTDFMGTNKLVDMIRDHKFDVLFVLQDVFNMLKYKNLISEVRSVTGVKYVLYFPVDGKIRKDWVEYGMKIPDKAITYTDFGIEEVAKVDDEFAKTLEALPHGFDRDTFFPIEEEERKNVRKLFFKTEDDDEFIITNVNRNQPRKDMVRCIRMFDKFVNENPEIKTRLYLHCRPEDTHGINLPLFATEYCSKETVEKISFPQVEIMAGDGFSDDVMRQLYCASDLVVSTTLGEGFGLSIGEAMSCGTPVMMPRNTAITDQIGDNEERGYLVNSGSDDNLWHLNVQDNNVLRPLTDVNEGAKKLKHIFDNRDERLGKAKKALVWVKELDWDKIASRFEEILEEQGKASIKEQKHKHDVAVKAEMKAMEDGTHIEKRIEKLKKS